MALWRCGVVALWRCGVPPPNAPPKRFCHAVPFRIGYVPAFADVLNLGDFDVQSATYEDQCETHGVREAMRIVEAAGFALNDPMAPVALLLRFGEATDAVRNFVASGTNASSAGEAAGYVLCGLMQVSVHFTPHVLTRSLSLFLSACLIACRSLVVSSISQSLSRSPPPRWSVCRCVYRAVSSS